MIRSIRGVGCRRNYMYGNSSRIRPYCHSGRSIGVGGPWISYDNNNERSKQPQSNNHMHHDHCPPVHSYHSSACKILRQSESSVINQSTYKIGDHDTNHTGGGADATADATADAGTNAANTTTAILETTTPPVIQRFDPTIDESEWQQITDDILDEQKYPLLDATSISPDDIVRIEESIFFWTVLVKRLYLVEYKNYSMGSSRENRNVPRNIHKKCALIVDKAFRSYIRISLAVQQFPFLLQSSKLTHWFDGQHPRSTHLLNQLLDSWKRTWVYHGKNRNSLQLSAGDSPPIVLSPDQLYLYLTENAVTTYTGVQMQQQEIPTPRLPFNCRSFTTLMSASTCRHAGNQRQLAPDFCVKLLKDMVRMSEENDAMRDDFNYKEDGIEKIKQANMVDCFPDTSAYTKAIHAWAKSGRPDAGKHAEELLNEMIGMAELRRSDSVRPDVVTYNTVLQACVSEQQTEAMIRAEQILYEMVSVPYRDVRPDTISFRTVVFGWANLSTATLPHEKIDERYNNVQRAHKVLQDAVSLMLTSGNTEIQIDSDFFSKLISQLTLNLDWTPAKKNNKKPTAKQYDVIKSSQLAEEIHKSLEKLLEQTQNNLFVPHSHMYCAIILFYCKTKRAEMAYTVICRAEQNALQEGNLNFLPLPVHYHDVINALEAEQLTTNCPPGPIAEKMVDMTLRMIRIAIATNDPKRAPSREFVINRVFAMLAKARDPMLQQEFLYMLLASYKESSFIKIKLTAGDFHRVMKTWVSTPNFARVAPEKIQDLFFVMHDLQQHDAELAPDEHHFATLIDAWSKSHCDGAVEKCFEILNQIRKAYSLDKSKANIQPGAALYASVFRALIRDDNGMAASQLLNVMIHDYKEGNKAAIVSTDIFNFVLVAWIRSNDDRAPIYALDVYNKMKELNCVPDEVTYHRLIEILSKAVEKTEEIDGNIRHFQQQLKKFRQPNHR